MHPNIIEHQRHITIFFRRQYEQCDSTMLHVGKFNLNFHIIILSKGINFARFREKISKTYGEKLYFFRRRFGRAP